MNSEKTAAKKAWLERVKKEFLPLAKALAEQQAKKDERGDADVAYRKLVVQLRKEVSWMAPEISDLATRQMAEAEPAKDATEAKVSESIKELAKNAPGKPVPATTKSDSLRDRISAVEERLSKLEQE